MLAFADDRIGLPMADLGALVGGPGPVLDAQAVDDAAPMLPSAGVALAALLLAAQVAVQIAAELLVGVDELVDPLVADLDSTFQASPLCDLLGAPVEPDKLRHAAPLLRRDAPSSAAGAGSILGQVVRLLGAVPALTAVAPKLPANRAGASAQSSGDLALAVSGAEQGPGLIPFLSGEVRIAHRATPTWSLESRC